MLDQLSYQPSPSGAAAANEVVTQLIQRGGRLSGLSSASYQNYMKFNEALQSYTFSRDTLYSIALDILSKKPPPYSLAAWYMGGCDEYCIEVVNEYMSKDRVKRKMRGILRSLALLHRIYSDLIEKRYAPNGVFETELAMKWNPLLQGGFPSTPPSSPEISASHT